MNKLSINPKNISFIALLNFWLI